MAKTQKKSRKRTFKKDDFKSGDGMLTFGVPVYGIISTL